MPANSDGARHVPSGICATVAASCCVGHAAAHHRRIGGAGRDRVHRDLSLASERARPRVIETMPPLIAA